MVKGFINYVEKTCPFCGITTKTTSSYTLHVKSCHKNTESAWYKRNTKVCPKCGKSFVGDGSFCSRSCANSHVQTDEQNRERSKKLLGTNTKTGKRAKYLSNLDPSSVEELLQSGIKKVFCKGCGKEIRLTNKFPYCSKCRGKFIPYSENAKRKQSEKMKGRPRWNIHRNQTSYAERFWIRVLDNNGILYNREVPVKKTDGIHCYFLDFEIKVNSFVIDLEIDGSQHKLEDRRSSDIARDQYLEGIGYKVYRIEWNDLKTDEGKEKMKLKIDDFLNFYKSLTTLNL